MRAIIIKQYGGPEQLVIEERPEPETKPVKHVSLFLPCRHFLTPFKVAVLPLSASAEVSPSLLPFKRQTMP